MKKIFTIILSGILLAFVSNLDAQVFINANVQINGFTHNWDCGNDGGGGQDPDPRYKVWIGYNGASFLQSSGPNELGVCSGQGVFGGDGISCSTFNPGIINAYTISNQVASTINVDMESWEEDGCGSECTKDACAFNSDDTRCGRLRIGDIDIWSGPPCTNNIYTGQGTSGNFLSMHNRCSDNNGAGYGINQLIINWSFASSPTITTQPTALAQGGPDRTLCIGTGTTMTVAVNSWNGWSLGQHYQWQVNTLTTNPVPTSSCPVTGWTNIPGATSPSYVPPQTPGTLLYRCVITSNCTADFTSRTVASECVRITYQPYAAPIISSVCGLSISPGIPYNFCATLPPNAGASVNNAYTWSVAPAAGVSIATPSASCTDITFTNNANYVITLTYSDVCPAANAAATCNVTISPSACNTIYVDAATGSDLNFGYETSPVQTINRAFQLIAGGRTWIRVAEGTYNESNIIQMQNNVVLEGGWVNTAGIWTKSTALADATIVNFSGNETINADVAHVVGIKADNDDGWAIQDITLNTIAAVGQTTSGNGKSNMVLYITNGCDNYNISRSKINAGAPTNALSATVGWQGNPIYNGLPTDPFDGNNGQNGAAGNAPTATPACDGCFLGCDQTGGNGGAASGGGLGGNNAFGGAAPNGGNGGAGGDGGDDIGTDCAGGSVAQNGLAGTGTAPGAGGTRFSAGCTNTAGDNFNANIDGNNASAAGTNGANGAAGTVGAANYATGYFVPGRGGDGTPGTAGSGGGGGAGAPEDIDAIDEPGVGGGSGGAGGGGGGAGRGGGGGGSSYGIFIFNNGTGSIIYDSQIATGGAGTGGNGGTGGTGGAAGGGSFALTSGGTRLINQHCGDANYGGGGGDGTAGGNGGNGGNGIAGVAHAISVRGAGTNPTVTTSPAITLNSSVSGGTVPNPINLGINYFENAKGCVNSEINISGNTTTWTLPPGAAFENNINSTTSSYNVNSNFATIIFSNAGIFDLTSFSLYNDVIRITDGSRTLPTITVNPTVVCSGSPFSLSGTTWGAEIDFEWIIFTNSATVPGDIIATSNQQIPTFTLSVGATTTYKIRYRVKEQCCGWSAPVYATVTINPPVTTPVTPMGATTFCLPAGSSVYTTTATNASGYNWSVSGAGNIVIGAGTTATVFFDPAFTGTGQVCVTALGCAGPTATICQTFTVNPTVGNPAIPVGITTRCLGLGVDTFSTFASNATSYTWSVTGAGNGAGGTTDSSLITWSGGFTGTAQVCVQAQGCGGPSTQACAIVNVLPAVGAPITPVGTSPICQNAANSLFVSSATDAADYTWSVTAGTSAITNNNDSVTVDWDPSFTGTAQICVTSTGCGSPQGPICSNVTVNPTVALPSTPSGTQLRCVGVGTDAYTSSAAGATSYTWILTPAGAGSISPLGVVTWNPLYSGNANVGVIANGCNGPSDTTFQLVSITGPVSDPAIPDGNGTRCQGGGSDAYTTSATNADSYIWTVTPAAAGTIAGTTSTETVNWDPAYNGTASVCVVAVGCNGNSAQICFNVNIDPAPAVPIITITGTSTFCDGGSAVLTSSSPTNNNWLPNNETTPSITVTQSGTYAVEATNSFGCTSTSTNTSIVVFPNNINLNVSYTDTVCSSAPFNIVASGTNVASYLWNTGDTTAILNPSITSQAVYSITMTDNNGCTADSTFSVEVYPYPNALDDNNTTGQDTAVITYVILNDNMSGTLSVSLDPVHGTTSIIGDSIEYIPELGYSGTDYFEYVLCSKYCPTQCDTARVTILINEVVQLAIPGGFSPNGDGQNDIFNIQGLENYPQNSLTVINRWGDIIYTAQPYNNDWDGSSNSGINIAGDHVTDGTYFYVFITSPGAEPIKGSVEIRRNN